MRIESNSISSQKIECTCKQNIKAIREGKKSEAKVDPEMAEDPRREVILVE